METIKKINMIEGVFNPNEINDLLIDFYNKNINFYKIKNFISQTRHDIDDEVALNKIEELNDSLLYIKSFIAEAKRKNKNIKINSFLEIEFED